MTSIQVALAVAAGSQKSQDSGLRPLAWASDQWHKVYPWSKPPCLRIPGPQSQGDGVNRSALTSHIIPSNYWDWTAVKFITAAQHWCNSCFNERERNIQTGCNHQTAKDFPSICWPRPYFSGSKRSWTSVNLGTSLCLAKAQQWGCIQASWLPSARPRCFRCPRSNLLDIWTPGILPARWNMFRKPQTLTQVWLNNGITTGTML